MTAVGTTLTTFGMDRLIYIQVRLSVIESRAGWVSKGRKLSFRFRSDAEEKEHRALLREYNSIFDDCVVE